ncbi:AAA family ATPase [Legionella pneumophila]|uniref:Uncharacterized protein n=1 Tax=Legionella pneumophila TaxID=446 RepID=A0A378K8Q5_LEGPN|nr:hypothetical protein [Legionella pneumophila]ABQ55280.1 hypothetical protein LPC_1323 [Legionella pneumophila str. Corby]ADG25214.1 hypothetical protein lpa_02705 [Legionella pneumophila 2300/99 Alcoy]MDW8959083.1 hypothetical protein [Legionella pneumophila]MDW9008297.1 hypothetical protein [Legionella pneumophila]CZG78229.1 Uncharacterised protein [Legionella pneumophila]
MPYTLTLLGTDTQFSPNRLEGAYDKAETLSYVSTLVSNKQPQDRTFPTDEIVKYRTSKIAVVDGPTTLGTEVGDRIARGVEAILEAISRGETDISIIAHSRGAVEAILVAHELERIQSLVEKGNFNRYQLTNSECRYTNRAMNRDANHTKAFDSLDLEKIANNIGRVKISMFNIDPVPGGNYMGITHASSLAWRDPRFYSIPKIVKEYEQYTYENERTRCFKPIVPKCASTETHFKLHTLPGHHGTGSGNLLDQQRGNIPSDKTTEHVQELVVVKLLDFLTRNNVTIRPKSSEEHDPFANITDQLFNGESIDRGKLKSLFFNLYEEISRNREAYQHFNRTSYAVLGQEQAILRRIWNITDQRIVHYQAHNDTYLDTVVPPVPGGHFLNYEHARLHLNQELGLEEGRPLSETINNAVDRLISVCRHTHQLKDLRVSGAAIDPTASVLLDKIAPTLDTREGFDLFLEGLGMLIDEVRRPYLQGELELINPEERASLYSAIVRAFESFNKYTHDNPQNELAKSILSSLNSNLESTLETKRKKLDERYETLSMKLRGKGFLTALQNRIKEIKTNLNEKSTGLDSSEYELDLKLQELLIQTEKLSNSRVEEIKETFEQALQSFREVRFTSELARNTQEWTCLVLDEAIDESLNYSVESLMSEVIKSYNELDNFKKTLPDFKILYDSLSYAEWESNLERKRDHMVHLAARYIAHEGLDLEKDIKPFFPHDSAIYLQIEALAIGLGARNPHIIRLLDENRLNLEKIDELVLIQDQQSKAIKVLTDNTIQQESLIEQLREREKELYSVNNELRLMSQEKTGESEQLVKKKEQLEMDVRNLKQKTQEHKKVIDELSQQIVALNNQIVELKLKNEEQTHRISGLEAEKIQEKQRSQTAENNAQAELIQQLLSPKEISCANLIEAQLVPSTNDYLHHLIEQAKKINPLVTDNIYEKLPPFNGSEADKSNYEKIVAKYDITKKMSDILNDKENIPLPSSRIKKFTETLQRNDKTLAEHRDPEWKRYVKNCLIAIGVICTGIIPGIVALMAYSTLKGKSSPMFFTNSAGKEYTDKVEKSLTQLPSGPRK